MKRPQLIKSIVINKNWLSSKVIGLTVEHMKPTEVVFTPGQFVSMKVDVEKYRAYSMCSDSKNIREFSLIISARHLGLGSSYARLLKQGDLVEFIGPSGNFMLKNSYSSEIYFFATGCGIAPFISMLYKLRDDSCNSKIRLYHGIRYKDELLFLNTLENFKNTLVDFSYHIFVSGDKEIGKFNEGRITSVLDNTAINNNAHYYLCGNPFMIEDVKKRLILNSVSEKNIFFEGFTFAVS